jgi:hypothetical protein
MQLKKYKKEFIILSLWLLLLCGVFITADYLVIIRTPNNSIVPDTYVLDEMSSYDIIMGNNYVEDNYPLAERISDASRRYNCHGYAWHLSEGGSYVWIGLETTTAEDIYWTDCSYVETSESLATKVRYSDNHSAITTSTPNYYISKWGRLPLVRHHRTYVPPGYGVPYKFYIRFDPYDIFDIPGPTTLCSTSTQTYTLSGIPSSISITWSKSSNLNYVSGQGTTSYSVRAASSTANTSAWVKATLSTSCSSRVITKNLWIGGPSAPSLVEYPIIFGSSPGLINAYSSTPGITYHWTIGGGSILWGQGTPFIMVQPNCSNYDVYVRVNVTNACGTSATTSKHIPIDCEGPTPL